MRDTGPGQMVQEDVTKDVQRCRYDLSHWSMRVGAIGGLQTMSVMPIVAGDSIELDASFVFRLSPLRRNLYLDCVVDLFAFYVPHSHVYGSDWVDFIKGGVDEGVTFDDEAIAATILQLDCLGFGLDPQVVDVPYWLTRGYMQIYHRYFQDPHEYYTVGMSTEDYFTNGGGVGDEGIYGLPCCHIKRNWNCAIPQTHVTADDYQLALDAGTVNLLQLEELKGRLRSERQRDFFAMRYQDVLKHTWGSEIGYSAISDKRPELIMRTRQWLSGYDVDGTDDASLGLYSGKAQALCNIKFPKKFFPEHGTLWIMGLLRFPPLVSNETHYLAMRPNPTYAQIAGDPSVINRMSPLTAVDGDFQGAGGANIQGYLPHSFWYREQPNIVHQDYLLAQGHPFLPTIGTTPGSKYIISTEYDDVFQSLMLKHWNAQGFVSVMADRFIPDSTKSIFAGSGGY